MNLDNLVEVASSNGKNTKVKKARIIRADIRFFSNDGKKKFLFSKNFIDNLDLSNHSLKLLIDSQTKEVCFKVVPEGEGVFFKKSKGENKSNVYTSKNLEAALLDAGVLSPLDGVQDINYTVKTANQDTYILLQKAGMDADTETAASKEEFENVGC